MRLSAPERGADEEAIEDLDLDVIEQAIHESFPDDYQTLSDRDADRLFETIWQYIAHREELKPEGKSLDHVPVFLRKNELQLAVHSTNSPSTISSSPSTHRMFARQTSALRLILS